jgi:hypothetical protein
MTDIELKNHILQKRYNETIDDILLVTMHKDLYDQVWTMAYKIEEWKLLINIYIDIYMVLVYSTYRLYIDLKNPQKYLFYNTVKIG